MEYQVKDLAGHHLDLAVLLALKKAPSFIWGWQGLVSEVDLENITVGPDGYFAPDKGGDILLVCPAHTLSTYDRIRVSNAFTVPRGSFWSTSARPEQGQPVLEHFGISVVRCDDEYGKDSKGFTTEQRIPVWCATDGQITPTSSTEHQQHELMYQVYESEVTYGPTMLVAGLRHFARQHLGNTIELPTKEGEE